MLGAGDVVVAAVSGGADSTALLRLLVDLGPELRLTIHVAHFNHLLRDDADVDAAFVADMARSLRLVFHQGSGDPRAQARSGRSLEDAARRLRYAFLSEIARETGAHAIATGHTLDDQAETVLMRVLRGTGPWGLAGIPPVRTHDGVRLIRPMIEVPRATVEASLRETGASWREDLTNRDLAMLRNRVRRVLLPALEGYNPDVRRTLARLAEVTRDEILALDALAVRRVTAVLSKRGATVRIALAPFTRLDPALQRRALREAVRRSRGNIEGVGFVHLEGARHVALAGRRGAVAELPGGLRMTRGGRWLELRDRLEDRDTPRSPGDIKIGGEPSARRPHPNRSRTLRRGGRGQQGKRGLGDR
jgi:tRNA(Ile)-lysidine synthase